MVVGADFESGASSRVNEDTCLWRQVHPCFVRENQITSQVFTPTPKDEGRLSVYDGEQIDAEQSWKHYTTPTDDRPGYPSIGVVAVTVGECEAQGTVVAPDPETFPEHVLVDFTSLVNARRKSVAKELSKIARERGWKYRPSASGS